MIKELAQFRHRGFFFTSAFFAVSAAIMVSAGFIGGGCASSKPARRQVVWTHDSLRFSKFEYDGGRKLLRVFPRQGNGIEYSDVPLEVYHELLSSGARGELYDKKIVGQFPSRELDW